MQTPIIIDVRTKEEFSYGHIPGSINVPLQDLQTYMSNLSKDVSILIVCESGARAMIAETLLKQHGFTQVVCGGSWRNVK